MQLPSYNLKQLDRITPSQFSHLKRCAYKVILSNSIDEPLLPYHPSSNLGRVIHKILELIHRGEIRDEEKFEEKWQFYISVEEEKLQDAGFDSSTPLKENVRLYALKKLQLKRYLTKSTTKEDVSSYKFISEKWLESNDRLIAGKIDLIIQKNSFIQLVDYKSGSILGDDDSIKRNYEEQIKLYAYLLNQSMNRYPDKLVLVNLKKERYEIEFTVPECEKLADEARKVLMAVNSKVNKSHTKQIANPNKLNCRNCLYRPACKYYWHQECLKGENFTDIKGQLVDVRKFENGSINVDVKKSGNICTITKIKSEHYEELISVQGKEVGFFNLYNGEDNFYYQALDNTLFYEI